MDKRRQQRFTQLGQDLRGRHDSQLSHRRPLPAGNRTLLILVHNQGRAWKAHHPFTRHFPRHPRTSRDSPYRNVSLRQRTQGRRLTPSFPASLRHRLPHREAPPRHQVSLRSPRSVGVQSGFNVQEQLSSPAGTNASWGQALDVNFPGSPRRHACGRQRSLGERRVRAARRGRQQPPRRREVVQRQKIVPVREQQLHHRGVGGLAD